MRASEAGEARLVRSSGYLLTELRFDISDCNPVLVPERRQTGAARFVCRRYHNAFLLWLRVRISQRTSALGGGSCDGGLCWYANRRRRSAWRIVKQCDREALQRFC